VVNANQMPETRHRTEVLGTATAAGAWDEDGWKHARTIPARLRIEKIALGAGKRWLFRLSRGWVIDTWPFSTRGAAACVVKSGRRSVRPCCLRAPASDQGAEAVSAGCVVLTFPVCCSVPLPHRRNWVCRIAYVLNCSACRLSESAEGSQTPALLSAPELQSYPVLQTPGTSTKLLRRLCSGIPLPAASECSGPTLLGAAAALGGAEGCNSMVVHSLRCHPSDAWRAKQLPLQR